MAEDTNCFCNDFEAKTITVTHNGQDTTLAMGTQVNQSHIYQRLSYDLRDTTNWSIDSLLSAYRKYSANRLPWYSGASTLRAGRPTEPDRATGIISPGRVFATARLCRRPPVRSTVCLSLAAVVQPLRIRALPGLSGTVGDHPVQPDRHGHGPAPASFRTLPARRGAAFYPQPATPAPGHPVSANRRSGNTRRNPQEESRRLQGITGSNQSAARKIQNDRMGMKSWYIQLKFLISPRQTHYYGLQTETTLCRRQPPHRKGNDRNSGRRRL